MEKTDIFDRIMACGALSPLRPFFAKHREVLLYLFFGGLTFFLSIGLFWLLTALVHMDALVANIIDWVVCVSFAYATNRTWVFRDKAHDAGGIARECARFFAGRLGTLALEELVLWVGIRLLRFGDLPVKIVAQILVIIGNYVISKRLVFRKE